MGISESEYLAQKDRNKVGPMSVQTNLGLRDERNPGHRAAMSSLSVPERKIAVAMSMDPRDFQARRVSRPGTAAARFASGIDGRQIIEEARAEHEADINDESTSTQDLVAEAIQALDDFDVADEDSWRKLAFAAACIQGAIERHAPPFANREPYGAKEAERRRRAG